MRKWCIEIKGDLRIPKKNMVKICQFFQEHFFNVSLYHLVIFIGTAIFFLHKHKSKMLTVSGGKNKIGKCKYLNII